MVMIRDMCDVQGLADVFTEFRASALDAFGIDPAYCMSAPGFGRDPVNENPQLPAPMVWRWTYGFPRLGRVCCSSSGAPQALLTLANIGGRSYCVSPTTRGAWRSIEAVVGA